MTKIRGIGYSKFELWQRYKYGPEKLYFCVEVAHTKLTDDRDSNIWRINLYVYPAHPWFSLIPRDRTRAYPFFDIDRGIDILEEKENCIILGCDYAHLHDDRYREEETPETCESVFFDAERLYDNYEKAIKE